MSGMFDWKRKKIKKACCHVAYLIIYGERRDVSCFVVTVINIGTSAQFTFVMPLDFSPLSSNIDSTSPVEYVPYFAGRYLSETASLNGGNSLASFVTTLCHWLKELGEFRNLMTFFLRKSAVTVLQPTEILEMIGVQPKSGSIMLEL